MTWFSSPTDAATSLRDTGYLADAATATTAYLAGALEKPLLVEGPAGVGKTELAKAVARATGADLVRLQCYEGLDEARALYEWNYKKQLLRIQASGGDQAWSETHDDIFTDEFLLTRPLLTAIRREEPTVLLVDEVDKTDVEVEGLLLEVLSDFQVTIPELGTVVAVRRPYVVLTSNASRELSEALKRRCLYLHLDYPDAEREREIVTGQVPDLDRRIAEQLVDTVGRLRDLDLKKAPSIAESVDWARTLVALQVGSLDDAVIAAPSAPSSSTPPTTSARRQGARPAVSGLVGRHIDFLEALRGAGLPVSLAEDLDAFAALGVLPWHDRETVRAGYAATVVKRQAQRPTFDALFDLYFPRLVGAGAATSENGEESTAVRDNAEALAAFRERLAEALVADDQQALQDLAVEAIGRFGAMPGRAPGLSGWSAYTALRRVDPTELTGRIVAALLRRGRADDEARRAAGRRIGSFTRLAEDDARRRIAEEKGPDHVADVAIRPAIDRLDFTAARRADLEEMRREIYPLARRLATRLTREHHALRRGPLDVRRTVRASLSTGGVPLVTRAPAQAGPPHRAGRAVRRQRLGRQLRPVHAAAGLRAARAVHQGARLHLRRPRPRGDPALPPRCRRRPT